MYASQWTELLPPAQTRGEPHALVGITEAHNQVRASVAVTPALRPLRWDDGLAQRAQDYSAVLASRGRRLEHSQDRGGIIGENAYWIGAPCPPAATAPMLWATEGECYSQSPGQVGSCDQVCLTRTHLPACGHYTQMVWTDVEAVGCGQTYTEGAGCYIVCQYGPTGNWVGEPAY